MCNSRGLAAAAKPNLETMVLENSHLYFEDTDGDTMESVFAP